MANYHPEREKQIETDASDLAKGAVLSQKEPDGKWHPIAFYSKKFSPAELNYDIHDKEMVVIVDCFKEWRHYLIGSPHRVVVWTDHRNVEYFNSKILLNRRQARWSELLSDFNYEIRYRPGELNGKADALSRRADPELEGGETPLISMFKPNQLIMEPEQPTQVILPNQLLICPLSKKGRLPTRGTAGAAGYDLYSAENTVVPPHTRLAVSTDISIMTPTGTYGRIAPRSGLAVKQSIDIAAGVIDADYRGPLKVCLVNNSNTEFTVKEGDRIAQLILESNKTPKAILVDKLQDTECGEKGFGNTGVGQLIMDHKVMALRLQKSKNLQPEVSWAEDVLKAGIKDETWMNIKTALESGKVIDRFTLEDNLVLYKNRIYIPDNDDLKLTVSR